MVGRKYFGKENIRATRSSGGFSTVAVNAQLLPARAWTGQWSLHRTGKRSVLVGQDDQREAQELIPALNVELAGCGLRRMGDGNEKRRGCRSWFLVDCWMVSVRDGIGSCPVILKFRVFVT